MNCLWQIIPLSLPSHCHADYVSDRCLSAAKDPVFPLEDNFSRGLYGYGVNPQSSQPKVSWLAASLESIGSKDPTRLLPALQAAPPAFFCQS